MLNGVELNVSLAVLEITSWIPSPNYLQKDVQQACVQKRKVALKVHRACCSSFRQSMFVLSAITSYFSVI